MAEPSGGQPDVLLVAGVKLTMDPSETQRVTAEFEQAARAMFDRLPDLQRNALRQEYQDVLNANRKKEDIARQHFDTVRKMLTDDLTHHRLSQAQYEQAMDETRKREQAKIKTFHNENEQAAKQSASRMSEFANEAMKGAAMATGIAGVFTIGGIIAQFVSALNDASMAKRLGFQLEALTGGMAVPGGAGEALFGAAKHHGVEPGQAGGMAAGLAATRRMSPGDATIAAADAIRMSRGVGMDPSAVVDMERQLLDRNTLGREASPEKLKETFLGLIRTADAVGAVYTDLAKNAMALNDIVRPMGFSFDQAKNMVAGFNDEIREGKVSVAALGEFMSSIARAPLGTQAFLGSQVLQNEKYMSQLGSEGQALLQGARNPLELGAAVRGMAFGEYGGAGSQGQVQSIMRQMVADMTRRMAGPGAHESAQAEVARMLLPSLGLGGQVAGMGPREIMKLLQDPEVFKKAMEASQKDPVERMDRIANEIAAHRPISEMILNLLRDLFKVVVYGFESLVHYVSAGVFFEGAPDALSAVVDNIAKTAPDLLPRVAPKRATTLAPWQETFAYEPGRAFPHIVTPTEHKIVVEFLADKGKARKEFKATTQGTLNIEEIKSGLGAMGIKEGK